jgi:outer membrane protein TolC
MSLIFRKVLFVGGLIFLTVDLFAQSEIQVLSLDDCIKIALENNLTIKRSSLDYQAANITLQEGKASRYPNLNLGTVMALTGDDPLTLLQTALFREK